MLGSLQLIWIAGGAGLAFGFALRYFHLFPSVEKYFTRGEAEASGSDGVYAEAEVEEENESEKVKEAVPRVTTNKYTVDLKSMPKIHDPTIQVYKESNLPRVVKDAKDGKETFWRRWLNKWIGSS